MSGRIIIGLKGTVTVPRGYQGQFARAIVYYKIALYGRTTDCVYSDDDSVISVDVYGPHNKGDSRYAP